MGRKQIRLKRGLKKDLPVLAYGEPAFVADENALYIGTEEGNILISGSGNTQTSASTVINNNLLINSNFHRGLDGYSLTPSLLDNNSVEDENYDNTIVLVNKDCIPQKVKPGSNIPDINGINAFNEPLSLYIGKDVTEMTLSTDFVCLSNDVTFSVYVDKNEKSNGEVTLSLGYSYTSSDNTKVEDITNITVNEDMTYKYSCTIPEGATNLKYVCKLANNSREAVIVREPKVEIGELTEYSVNENDIYMEIRDAARKSANPNLIVNSGLTESRFQNIPVNSVKGFYTASLLDINSCQVYSSTGVSYKYDLFKDTYYEQNDEYYMINAYANLCESDLMFVIEDNCSYYIKESDDDNTCWLLSSYSNYETKYYNDWIEIDKSQSFATASVDMKMIISPNYTTVTDLSELSNLLYSFSYNDLGITEEEAMLYADNPKGFIDKYSTVDTRPYILLGVDFMIGDKVLFTHDRVSITYEDLILEFNCDNYGVNIYYSINPSSIRRYSVTKAIPGNASHMRFTASVNARLFYNYTCNDESELIEGDFIGYNNEDIMTCMRHFKLEYGSIATEYCNNINDNINNIEYYVNENLLSSYADDSVLINAYDLINSYVRHIEKPLDESKVGHYNGQYVDVFGWHNNNNTPASMSITAKNYLKVPELCLNYSKSTRTTEYIEYIISFCSNRPFKRISNKTGKSMFTTCPTYCMDIDLSMDSVDLQIIEKKSYLMDYELSELPKVYFNYVRFKVDNSINSSYGIKIILKALKYNSNTNEYENYAGDANDIFNIKLECPEYQEYLNSYNKSIKGSKVVSLPTRSLKSLYSRYCELDKSVKKNLAIDYSGILNTVNPDSISKIESLYDENKTIVVDNYTKVYIPSYLQQYNRYIISFYSNENRRTTLKMCSLNKQTNIKYDYTFISSTQDENGMYRHIYLMPKIVSNSNVIEETVGDKIQYNSLISISNDNSSPMKITKFKIERYNLNDSLETPWTPIEELPDTSYNKKNNTGDVQLDWTKNQYVCVSNGANIILPNINNKSIDEPVEITLFDNGATSSSDFTINTHTDNTSVSILKYNEITSLPQNKMCKIIAKFINIKTDDKRSDIVSKWVLEYKLFE